jgi:hypothetical protein
MILELSNDGTEVSKKGNEMDMLYIVNEGQRLKKIHNIFSCRDKDTDA